MAAKREKNFSSNGSRDLIRNSKFPVSWIKHFRVRWKFQAKILPRSLHCLPPFHSVSRMLASPCSQSFHENLFCCFCPMSNRFRFPTWKGQKGCANPNVARLKPLAWMSFKFSLKVFFTAEHLKHFAWQRYPSSFLSRDFIMRTSSIKESSSGVLWIFYLPRGKTLSAFFIEVSYQVSPSHGNLVIRRMKN